MRLLPAAPADECVIEARILNETISGEHKVKITGVIISEVRPEGSCLEKGGTRTAALRAQGGAGLSGPACWGPYPFPPAAGGGSAGAA
jgi:hypothetical protein